MIYESGRVVAVHDGAVSVACQSRSDCARCAAGNGCGAALLNRAFGSASPNVEALNGGERLATGDEVRLALPESTLLRAAALAYLVPLAGLIGGAVAGQAAGGDAVAMAGGALGLLTAFALARVLARRDPAALYPVARRR